MPTCLLYDCVVKTNEYQVACCMVVLCKLTNVNLPIIRLRCANERMPAYLLHDCIVQANEYQFAYYMIALCKLTNASLPVVWLYCAS